MTTVPFGHKRPTLRYSLLVLAAIAILSGCAGWKAHRVGASLNEKGDYVGAVEAFERALASDPKNEKYNLALSDARWSLARQITLEGDAVPETDLLTRRAAYQRATEINAKFASASEKLARVQREIQQVDRDVQLLRRAASGEGPGGIPSLLRQLTPYRASMTTVNEAFAFVQGRLDVALAALGPIYNLFGARHVLEQAETLRKAFPREPRIERALAWARAEVARYEAEERVAEERRRRAAEAAEQLRRAQAAARLHGFAEKAETAGSPAIALHYYRRALELEPGVPRSEKVARLGSLVRDRYQSKAGILYSDEVPPSLRTEIALALERLGEKDVREVRTPADLVRVDVVYEVSLDALTFGEDGRDRTEKKWSRARVGYRDVPNPEYARAQVEYQRALIDYRRVMSQPSQPCYGNAWACAAVGVLEGVNQGLARVVVDRAQETLAQTPLFNQEPVEQAYAYGERTIVARAVVTFGVKLVDTAHKTIHWTDRIEVVERREEREIVGAHPDDVGGVKDRAYRREESEVLFTAVRDRAVRQIAARIGGGARGGVLEFRGRDLLKAGGALRAYELLMAYGEFSGNHDRGIEAMLEGGLPSGTTVDIAASRSLPPETLVSRVQARLAPQHLPSGPGAGAASAELSTQDIVRLLGPAVVTVQTMFGEGSGVVVRNTGLVVTNAHVVDGAKDVAVHLADGRRVFATVLKRVPEKDLAILRIEAQGLTSAPIGLFDAVEVGERVVAIGAPRGLARTVTQGIVSAKRTLPGGVRLIQTDAAVNPGNLGGPLLDRYGRIIGIVTFKLGEGLGFGGAAEEVASLVAGLE